MARSLFFEGSNLECWEKRKVQVTENYVENTDFAYAATSRPGHMPRQLPARLSGMRSIGFCDTIVYYYSVGHLKWPAMWTATGSLRNTLCLCLSIFLVLLEHVFLRQSVVCDEGLLTQHGAEDRHDPPIGHTSCENTSVSRDCRVMRRDRISFVAPLESEVPPSENSPNSLSDVSHLAHDRTGAPDTPVPCNGTTAPPAQQQMKATLVDFLRLTDRQPPATPPLRPRPPSAQP